MTAAAPPDTTRTPDGFDLQGHRGARGLAPENTIPAFRRALEIGVTTLEMDVVVAGDGTVVVSHEPWMAHEKCRTPQGERISESDERTHNLYEMTYAEIEAYDCGGLRLPDFPEQTPTSAPKPRLRDVLRMAEAYVDDHDRAPVFYNIETKSRPDWEGTFHPDPHTFAERVLAVVEAEGVAPRTTIQSFDPRTLEATHERTDAVRLALLVAPGMDGAFDEHLARLSFTPDVYSPAHSLVDADLVAAVHDRGLHLVPWTVNDPFDMERLIQLGVDGLITDYPDRGRAVVRRLQP
jgi:glycerophosphoryl diester phosphodiesterase